MPKLTSESFEGFPYGDLSFGRYDREFQGFLLQTADTILEGTPHTPEPLRTQHHIEINFKTDAPDPNRPDKNMRFHLILPVEKEEYDLFKRPDNRIPVLEKPVPPADEPKEDRGLLAMFVPEDTGEDDLDDDDEQAEGEQGLTWTQRHFGSRNLAYLARADIVQGMADTFFDRVRLEDYLASYNVPLPRSQPRITAAMLGIELHFVGADEKQKYPMLQGAGVHGASDPPIDWGQYYSPFRNVLYSGTVGDSFFGEGTVQDPDQWREAVTEDMERVRSMIAMAAAKMRASVTDLFEYRDPFSTSPYMPNFRVHRRSEYFRGYQQFARAGMTLLHVSQLEDIFEDHYDAKVRIDVCEKKTDESRPNHVVFWADSEPEGYVNSTRAGFPDNADTDYFKSGFGGDYGEMTTVKAENIPDYWMEAFRKSGLTDEDITDIKAGKKWGEAENPFSHKDYFKIVEFLGKISSKPKP